MRACVLVSSMIIAEAIGIKYIPSGFILFLVFLLGCFIVMDISDFICNLFKEKE